MLDSWGTEVCLDPFGMCLELRGRIGVLHWFVAVFQISWGLLLAPLFLSDSGPASLVCTILRALTSVSQEPQPSVPP